MDGNADTDMRNKHCSHTNQDNPSWWRVDLALDHTAVYEIHIVNRFTGDPGKNNVDYKITFGEYIHVVFLKHKPRHTTWRYMQQYHLHKWQYHLYTFCELHVSLKEGHIFIYLLSKKLCFRAKVFERCA